MSADRQSEQRKRQVEQGYDLMAEGYLSSKDAGDSVILGALEELVVNIAPGSRVLDLGCGAGVPALQFLSARFDATGVDISAHQLELAREYAPKATLIKSDMSSLSFPPATFSAITAFYSIIHMPRDEQPDLLARIYEWLIPAGRFLATWPLSEWEGTEENWEGWGGLMWWSHFGREKNLDMLRQVGFIIESAVEVRQREEWLWVRAAKPLFIATS